MSECTEHPGDPLACKKGPGLNQQDSPGGGRSACNSTSGIVQEGGGGGVGGGGKQVARNPGAHPPPPNPRISLPEQTLGDLERVPWVARILLWAVSFWEEECWFLLGLYMQGYLELSYPYNKLLSQILTFFCFPTIEE